VFAPGITQINWSHANVFVITPEAGLNKKVVVGGVVNKALAREAAVPMDPPLGGDLRKSYVTQIKKATYE
jgi:hypothetical protein